MYHASVCSSSGERVCERYTKICLRVSRAKRTRFAPSPAGIPSFHGDEDDSGRWCVGYVNLSVHKGSITLPGETLQAVAFGSRFVIGGSRPPALGAMQRCVSRCLGQIRPLQRSKLSKRIPQAACACTRTTGFSRASVYAGCESIMRLRFRIAFRHTQTFSLSIALMPVRGAAFMAHDPPIANSSG